MERYCSSCGKKLDSGMIICPQCGANQNKGSGSAFLSKNVIGILDIVAGGLATLTSFTSIFGETIIDFGIISVGVGLIMTGVFFLTDK